MTQVMLGSLVGFALVFDFWLLGRVRVHSFLPSECFVSLTVTNVRPLCESRFSKLFTLVRLVSFGVKNALSNV